MKLKSEHYSVVVVATMSSGKSTTLNAMLGLPLLPAKNEACTAILTKIEDVDGLSEIRARPINLDGNKLPWQIIPKGDNTLLNEWNCAENQAIEIQGDFPHIDNHSKSIKFIDTPGPNNSTDKSHAEITRKIISCSDHSFVVFIMNATQFGVDDERSLLESVYGELDKKNKHTNIVFAVNKIDQLDVELGETPTKLIQKVKSYLENIGFISPNVIPIMSQISLEIRQCLQAHREGKSVPFIQRRQKRIYSEVIGLLENFHFYLDALLNSKNKDEYLDRAFNQNRNIKLTDSLILGENALSIAQLIEADYLTGIPFLEEMLELELLSDHEDKYKVNNFKEAIT